jgi:hypothetical protein
MNERIKLPAQEWLGYDPERGDLHGYTFEQMREFADLIVRECIKMVENEAEQYAAPTWAVELVNDMHERFGVAE